MRVCGMISKSGYFQGQEKTYSDDYCVQNFPNSTEREVLIQHKPILESGGCKSYVIVSPQSVSALN